MNTISYLLVSVYSAFSPAFNTAAAICTVSGQQVPCPHFLNVLGPTMPIIMFLLIAIMVVALWRIFTKAGQPGWAAIIPVYNVVVILQIVKRPLWWIILAFIPIVNVVIGLIVLYELARVFGKGLGFTLGLLFLPIIFYPILGFGSATYNPPL